MSINFIVRLLISIITYLIFIILIKKHQKEFKTIILQDNTQFSNNKYFKNFTGLHSILPLRFYVTYLEIISQIASNNKKIKSLFYLQFYLIVLFIAKTITLSSILFGEVIDTYAFGFMTLFFVIFIFLCHKLILFKTNYFEIINQKLENRNIHYIISLSPIFLAIGISGLIIHSLFNFLFSKND